LRAAKTLTNEKISEICHHNPRTAIVVEAPDDAQATAGVTVDFTAVAATGVTVLDAVVPAEIPLVVALPPLWNTWWCGACFALHFIGDGGELRGPCLMCQVRSPICNHVMLDPDEREQKPSYVYTFFTYTLKEITALGCDFFRKYTDTQICIRTCRNLFFRCWTLFSDGV